MDLVSSGMPIKPASQAHSTFVVNIAHLNIPTVMNLKTPAGRKHKTCNGECSQTQNLKAGSSESSLAPPCDDCSFWWCSEVLLHFVMIL